MIMCVLNLMVNNIKICENWGGLDKYEYTKKHDNIKNEYCIKLYRIKYDENITDKLSQIVNDLNK